MIALVAGASGLVGSELVNVLVKSGYYRKVIVLVRKTGTFLDPLVREHLFDYDSPVFPEDAANDIFVCLGTTIRKAGSKDAFRKVDLEYVKLLADTAEELNANSFQVVSSGGANANSSTFYLKVKGEMEAYVSSRKLNSCHILRPSLILGDRREFRFGEWLGKVIMKPFIPFMKGRMKAYRPIHAKVIAKAMLAAAKSGIKGVQVLSNEDIFVLMRDVK